MEYFYWLHVKSLNHLHTELNLGYLLVTYLHFVQKRTKNQCGKLKKIQDFCPWDMESCHLAAARLVKLWSLNVNLFFDKPHQLTKFA